MFEQFPYADLQQLNLDWIIKIAKDFLDQYTSIQQIISDGLEQLDAQTAADVQALADKATELEGLLEQWYNTHSEDIANELSAAVASFTIQADAVGQAVIESIPADYTALGTAMSNLKESLNVSFDPLDDIYSNQLTAGYYSTVDGSKQTNNPGSYKMIPFLIRAEGGAAYSSNTTDNIRIACFDRNFNFISSCWALNDTFREKRDFTPANTYYVGLHVDNANSISIRKLDAGKETFIEYPFTNKNILFLPNTWMQGNGTIEEVNTLSMVVTPGLTPGDKYFVNNGAAYPVVFLDKSYNVITASAAEQVGVNAQIVTVPSGAAIGYWNLYNSHTFGTAGQLSGYIQKITKNKVLCIGDSLSWLDGQFNYGGMYVFSGYQRAIRRDGYDVRSAAWSGYPYADNLDYSQGVYYSLYTEIVANQYDVTGFDYVVLFGGTNDVLYNGSLGNRPTDYSNRVFDKNTFNGALGAIISYIRTNNPTAKIILASFPKSEAASRVFPNAVSRVDELAYNAVFWSCEYEDIFTRMNVQPTYAQFDSFFYDETHPNYDGMQIIGGLMLEAIQRAR